MENKKKRKFGNINYLSIIFIIGIIILIFGNSISWEKGKESKVEKEITPSFDFYEEEVRLERILSKIKGVGRVSVMITYENDGVFNYLSDSSYENNSLNDEVKKSQTVVMTSGEPVMYEQKLPKVKGVVVVCDGAKNKNVRGDVISAVCAVMGVYEHRVGVFEANK